MKIHCWNQMFLDNVFRIFWECCYWMFHILMTKLLKHRQWKHWNTEHSLNWFDIFHIWFRNKQKTKKLKKPMLSICLSSYDEKRILGELLSRVIITQQAFEFSLNVFAEFSDKNICHYSKMVWTGYLLCKRPGWYYNTGKTHARDRIFKLSPVHASVIYQIPWIHCPLPFRENSIFPGDGMGWDGIG